MRKFSVILPVYKENNPLHLKESIESILNQKVKPNELIIVIDGPIESKIENILSNYNNLDFVSLIYLKINMGAAISRNIGIKNSKNEIIALMDADDICFPLRFEKQIKYFENSEIDVVGSWFEEFNKFPGDEKIIRKVPEFHEDIVKHGKFRNPTNNVTVMFKKKSYLDVGGYNDQRNNEDYDLFIRMIINKSIFYNIQESLVHVRAGSDMVFRRRNFSHFKHNLMLFPKMYKMKYINFFELIVNVSVRLILRILPIYFSKVIYKKFLRNKINDQITN